MKTFTRFLFVLCAFFGARNVVFGQVSSYQFSQDRSVSLVQQDALARVVLEGSPIDDQAVARDIDFPFTFNGQQYRSVTIGANGWISFGGTPNDRIRPISSINANGRLGAQGIIGILAGDLRGRSNTVILTRTSTVNGVREFVIQWSNIQNKLPSFVQVSVNTTYTMEITLRENGIITFEYGTFRIDPILGGSNPLTASVGLRGASDGDISLRTMTGATGSGISWQNTRAAGNANDVNTVGTTWSGTPENVRMTWTPAQLTPIRPQAPTLVSPSNNASVSGVFQFVWNAVQGPSNQSYRVELFNNTGFSQKFNGISGTSRQAIASDYAVGTYSWRVQSVVGSPTGELTSTWSEVRTIAIGVTPIIRSAVPAAANQGQTVQMDIVGTNSSFLQSQTVTLRQGNATPITGAIGVRTNTTMRVSFAIPATAPTGAYSLFINNVPTPLTAALFVSAPLPPPPSPMVPASSEVKSDFNPKVHGWGFSNLRRVLWPESAWPSPSIYTNSSFPKEVRDKGPTINVRIKKVPDSQELQPQNFPSFDDHLAAYQRDGYSISAAATDWVSNLDAWGGSCGGMTISAMFAYVAAQPNSGANLSAYRFSNNPAAITETLIPNSLRKLINRHQSLQSWSWSSSSEEALWSSMKTIAPLRTVELIRENLQKARNLQYGIAIDGPKPNQGHALIPYRVVTRQESGNRIDDVYVYDPNWSNDDTKFIRVTTNLQNNTSRWRYEKAALYTGEIMPNNEYWEGGNGTFTLVAPTSQMKPFTSLPSKVFANAHSSDDSLVTFTEISFSNFTNTDGSPLSPVVIVSDAFSNSIGNTGKILEEPTLENVRVKRPLDGLPPYSYTAIQGFQLPQQANRVFSVIYQAVDTNRQNSIAVSNLVDKFLSSYSWIAGSNLQSQGIRVDLPNNLLVVKATSNNKNTSFQVVKILSQEIENVIRIQNSTLAANDSLDVQLLNDGDSFIINNYNSAKTYDLNLQRGGERTFTRIQIGANEQQRFFVQNWANIERSGVIALVDRGMDGVIDSTITFSEFVTTDVKDLNALTIDRNTIQMEAYPNPSNGQMTLEYSLPLAAMVQIDVLNLLGQPVLTVLQEQQFSGKHSIPTDLQGIPSGTYFLRIRAGNATVVKPVQIIK